MALKILLADDSMTAQNMGKKILTEAGYEVIAVSNGAQAVKKIASEKPDLAVLDVFMPGYTGVEVCERVRKGQETAHMPVLLTVGKMEPFKPEEGTRAGADGLVVKPFEASDLLAAIKKIAERLAGAAAAPPPESEATVKIAVEEFQDASYEEWKVSAPETPAEEEAPATARLSVPDDMAASPAFGMDFDEPAAVAAPAASDTQPIEPPPAAHVTEPITPAVSMRSTAPIAPPPEVFEAARATAEMPASLQAAAGAAAVHEEPVAVPSPAAHHEVEFTSHRVDHEVDHTP
ncbi:MAG TPA: response regulator, partial [Terriglobales bacterium]|nr:response regulator [Terriglobales bacterium]